MRKTLDFRLNNGATDNIQHHRRVGKFISILCWLSSSAFCTHNTTHEKLLLWRKMFRSLRCCYVCLSSLPAASFRQRVYSANKGWKDVWRLDFHFLRSAAATELCCRVLEEDFGWVNNGKICDFKRASLSSKGNINYVDLRSNDSRLRLKALIRFNICLRRNWLVMLLKSSISSN